ncbi:hypothetical protein BKA66DRAFT_411012 [Pyrenochaeta sp. MPI-SDFR-AT-0127]|nr:hypothetical protein BKA66DRAFT_411012 [Pyrenochaeta sp. MPI-SDFR-AT-0127]
MDPLSVTFSCVTLFSTVSKVSYSLWNVIQESRDARGDLEAISRELSSIQMVLESLSRETAKPHSSILPVNLKNQIFGILKNCNVVVVDIETSLKKHAQSRLGRSGYWIVGGGKNDMAKYRFSLEAHKSALEIALAMIAISTTQDIKKDTSHITSLKEDIRRILKELERLKQQLPGDVYQTGRTDADHSLKQYLNDMIQRSEYRYGDESMVGCSSAPERLREEHGNSWNGAKSTTTDYRLLSYIQLSPNTSCSHNDPSLTFPSITYHVPDETTVLRIGRHSNNGALTKHTIAFKSKVVSRAHCEIWRKDGVWYIKDVKSSSGTFINGVRLSRPGKTSKPCCLEDGDVVQLGVDYQNGFDLRGQERLDFRRVIMAISLREDRTGCSMCRDGGLHL